MRKITTGALAIFCLSYITCSAQLSPDDALPSSTPSQYIKVSDRALDILNNKYSYLQKIVQRHAERALQNMEKKELSLQRKVQAHLHGTDSIRAAALFTGTAAKYEQMLRRLRTTYPSPDKTAANPLKEYLPRVDSMQTALRFLGDPALALQSQTQKIQTLNAQLTQLQAKLQNANDLQSYFSGREHLLQTQLSNMGFNNQLLQINQASYYYQAKLTEYKSSLDDPEKFQQIVLSAIRESPLFKTFWQKNSYWSSLFPAQNDSDTMRAAAGLQTRGQLQEDVQRRLGKSLSTVSNTAAASGGGGSIGYLQGQMQNMQQQLTALKAKLASSGNGTGANITQPDFQPNNQHNRTFLHRLEYSFNIQNASSTALLPAISTLGLNLGYKLSDNAVVGVGGTYLVGLGYGIDRIQLTNQGIGYRVFGDVRAKGSIWISGGLENTYLQQFRDLQGLRNPDVWQKSALIGLTKKYRIGKKTGEIQLLYDLLAPQQVPAGQPLKFRLGWSL